MPRGVDDLIAAEVHRKAMQNITREMGTTLMRTSGSPIAIEAHDFSTCLMDLEPEHLAFGAAVLAHIGSSLVGTRVINELEQDGDIRPGDGYIVNDPHSAGALHQGDVSVIMPTFFGTEQTGWSFVNLHVLDIGGMGVSGFSPGAHEVWNEGILFPPIRIIREGAIDSGWRDFIAANVRVPGPVINDIQSMIAANVTAERQLSTIVEEYGLDRHRAFCARNKDLSETLMRERIEAIPDGVYESTYWAEFDGHGGDDMLLDMHLDLEIAGSDMRMRFSGAPQIDAFINTTEGSIYGMAMAAVVVHLGYGDLPVNGGFWRPIEIDIGEPGTIVNALPPAPVSMGHAIAGGHACSMVRDALSQALSLSSDPVLRRRISGRTTDGFVGTSLFGLDQYGDTSVMFYNDGGVGSGGPAQTIGDGLDLYGFTCMVDAGLADVESHEQQDPILFLWRRVLANSGGPGQNRGGQGLEQAFAMRYSEGYRGPAWNTVAQVPPQGLGGGLPAGLGYQHVLRDSNLDALIASGRLPTVDRLQGSVLHGPSEVSDLVLARGDVLVAGGGGGSGLGDPLLRPVEAVLRDLADGYVTAEHAEAVYGVIRDEEGAIDAAATETARTEIRRARIGAEPSSEASAPANIGVAVALSEDGAWVCGSCEGELAGAGEEWRQGEVVLREAPISERFKEWEMPCRDRPEPIVVLREYFCKSCAASLAVDVATDAVPAFRNPQLSNAVETGGSRD